MIIKKWRCLYRCRKIIMAQIKATIELLLKILKENGTTKISAETLRQAKFNHNASVRIHTLSPTFRDLDFFSE